MVKDEVRYLTERISKQSAKSMAWFLLVAYSTMQEENISMQEPLTKKEPELGDLEYSQLIHILEEKVRKDGMSIKGVLDNNLVECVYNSWMQSSVSTEARKRDGTVTTETSILD